MNKSDLIDAVAGSADMSKAEAGRAVEAVFGSITGYLSSNGTDAKVTVPGFGTFKVGVRKARMGATNPAHAKNPSLPATIDIPARCTPSFKAGKQLKDSVSAGNPVF